MWEILLLVYHTQEELEIIHLFNHSLSFECHGSFSNCKVEALLHFLRKNINQTCWGINKLASDICTYVYLLCKESFQTFSLIIPIKSFVLEVKLRFFRKRTGIWDNLNLFWGYVSFYVMYTYIGLYDFKEIFSLLLEIN